MKITNLLIQPLIQIIDYAMPCIIDEKAIYGLLRNKRKLSVANEGLEAFKSDLQKQYDLTPLEGVTTNLDKKESYINPSDFISADNHFKEFLKEEIEIDLWKMDFDGMSAKLKDPSDIGKFALNFDFFIKEEIESITPTLEILKD